MAAPPMNDQLSLKRQGFKLLNQQSLMKDFCDLDEHETDSP